MISTLQFRRVTGSHEVAEVWLDEAEFPAAAFLMARRVRLDGIDLRQHRVVKGARQRPGYDRLDNEILAGRRLYEVAEWSGYPPEVTLLYGDEATSANPYALFEPYRGEPLSHVGRHLLADEQEAFQASLLNGLCWLAAAGLAHRALSPDKVLWDSQRRQVQITDFSLSTVFGAPREAIMGSPDWVAREQRPGSAVGTVGERDDIWAAGRLIFFVRNQGEDLTVRSQITGSGLATLLDGVFGPPDGRPTAGELLARMGRHNPVPGGTGISAWLKEGRRRFWDVRERKHPGAAIPPNVGEYGGKSGRMAPPVVGNGSGPAGSGDTVATGVTAQASATGQRAARPMRARWKRGGG